MNDEFENALAWFSAAPKRWIDSAKTDLSAGAEWIWGVLQGDFNDNASTAQVATGTVISMIPFVDQICDVRDVIANCKKINSDSDNNSHWIALALTLLGLLPTIGSLLKGCGKVMFSSARLAAHKTGAAPIISQAIDFSITSLNKFLARPEVVKTLKVLRINNPYRYLAKQLRKISAELNLGQLLKAFDEAKKAAETLLNLIRKWGGDGIVERAAGLIQILENVQRLANKGLARALKPVQNYLEQLARRLDYNADLAHRAHLNTVNPHAFARITDAAEAAEFNKKLPSWADANKGLTHKPLTQAPITPAGWRTTARDPNPNIKHPMDDAHTTFESMNPVTIPPGETLYRVIAPNSLDNSICWMRKAEFDKLKSKADWRRRFAVWAAWNRNGEYVTYVVPPGKGLNVWEGVTASQAMKNNPTITLEGGAIQLVINPDDLVQSAMGKRQPTNWGYDEFGNTSNLVGVPTLTNNWK
jgi:hypothetical protein